MSELSDLLNAKCQAKKEQIVELVRDNAAEEKAQRDQSKSK